VTAARKQLRESGPEVSNFGLAMMRLDVAHSYERSMTISTPRIAVWP
jgi:hypothetical protein